MPSIPKKRPLRKPKKPYEGFPLFAHATGRWAKKIRGKLHYFGPWRDPDGALAKYMDQRDALHAGRTPRTPKDGLTVRQLCNHFLTAKRHQLDTRDIAECTFRDYYSTCSRILAVFGKDRFIDDLTAGDFQQLRATIAKTSGVVRLGNEVQRVRCTFKYGYDAGLIDKAIRYGPTFKKPSKRVLRQTRLEREPQMFEAAELRAVLDSAPLQIRTMVLLGVNSGFGNQDCATLPLRALDLAGGWVDHARPKTGVDRRCSLWAETVQGLRAVIEARREPRAEADADLVFITKYGKRWGNGTTSSPISVQLNRLLKQLGLYRHRVGFYALRHVFETVAGGSKDQVAVDSIMGHLRDDMASLYRERIDDDRLLAVTDHVHRWLFETED